MISIPKRETSNAEYTDLTLAELHRERDVAKECFDKALVEKTEADRIYVAAANRLNALDRLVKRLEHRAAVAERAAAKAQFVYQTA